MATTFHWLLSLGIADSICGQSVAQTDPSSSISIRSSRAGSSNEGVFVGGLGKQTLEKHEDVVLFVPISESSYSRNDSKLLALNVKNGNVIWETTIGKPIWAPPVIAEGKLFIGGTDSAIYAFDVNKGQQLWKRTVGAHIGCSPIYRDGRVYIGSYDSFLYVLESAKGEVLWKTCLGSAISSAAVLCGDLVLCASQDGDVVAFHIQSGESKWKRRLSGRVVTDLLVAQKAVYVPCWDGFLYAIDILTGRELWRARTGEGFAAPGIGVGGVGGAHGQGGLMCTPAIAAGRVYGPTTNGVCLCWDAMTGKELWQTAVKGDARRSPALAKDILCFGSRDPNRLYALNSTNGNILWNAEIGGEVFYAPAIYNGTVFVGSKDHKLYAFGLRDGAPLWTVDLQAEVGAPTIATYATAGTCGRILEWLIEKRSVLSFPRC